ncbi:potassium channel family protein [Streptomyces bambusae]|uniref:potassium channel family protein n=1 Tax=Streptomyces bambusae TaxID=1550616 RepID=UPI001CFD2E34|nr:potassium channel family protein [Streptomyces bambusae]MCB5165350.1 potassium channel family protein [Streptomyces bambusae]
MDPVTDPRQENWERRSEVPLFLVSLAFTAGYAVRVLTPHSDAVLRDAALVIVFAAWGCFAADYAVRLALSGRRPLHFARTHLLDTLVLVLPLLRPLRMVQVYTAFQRRRAQPRLGLYGRVISYASLSAVLLGFSGALTVYDHEHLAPDASIRTFGDAVWWVCATLTTVGYGDVAPVTAVGRTVAAGLMFGGLALLGAVTGSFSSWLLQVFTREDEKAPGK